MLRGISKNILLFLSLIVLAIGAVVVFLQPRKSMKSIDAAYSLIPMSVETVIEVQNTSEFNAIYKLLLGDNFHGEQKLSTSLRKLLEKAPVNSDPFLILTNHSKKLDDGFLILPASVNNRLWVESFLKDVEQVDQPYRTIDYKGFNIRIYSLTIGWFFSSVIIDGYLVLSNQVSNLYGVIDTLLEVNEIPSSRQSIKRSISKTGISTIYTKKLIAGSATSEFEWNIAYLIKNNEKISLVEEMREGVKNYYINDNISLEDLSEGSFNRLPENTFAVTHYTQAQLKQVFDINKNKLPLSINESEWYESSLALIESGLLYGLLGYRVSDPVISSNLILKSSDSLFLSVVKNLEVEKKELIRKLLREETTYYSPRLVAYPSPAWLNELFEVSRDQRVLYIAELSKTNILLSWDFNLLSSHIQSLESQLKHDINPYNEAVLLSKHYFYIGDLSEIKKDTLISHKAVPQLVKDNIDRVLPFYYIDEFLPTDGRVYRMQSLKFKN